MLFYLVHQIKTKRKHIIFSKTWAKISFSLFSFFLIVLFLLTITDIFIQFINSIGVNNYLIDDFGLFIFLLSISFAISKDKYIIFGIICFLFFCINVTNNIIFFIFFLNKYRKKMIIFYYFICYFCIKIVSLIICIVFLIIFVFSDKDHVLNLDL